MGNYQLPPLKDEKKFEELVCETFNQLENTETYINTDFQTFGIKGQNQKGIDIFSSKTKTVIQCKLKDLRKSDNYIRKNLKEDIKSDLFKVEKLEFSFERFIFISTFRDDSQIQEFLNNLKQENSYSFDLYYWGWDTLSKNIEEHEIIIHKYFPKFKPKKTKSAKPELPENAIGLFLLEKNYMNYLISRYGDWKQIELNRRGEKFNWGAFKSHLIKKYHSTGINHIHIEHFVNIEIYLKERIDKTTFGRNRKAKGQRNYSEFSEHKEGINE